MSASVVKQTMIMLSDAVTTMMLLVVPLQESNAPMSQELPQKTQAVAQISEKISIVADGLANEEYDAFPEIQKEMLDASADVRNQVGGLEKAISELRNGSNRKRGWEILVSSCTSISTKTVLLLKIVYGVEIKRVMASAKRALAKVNAVNPSELATNPKGFVNKVQDAATELDQLGDYMALKAEDPDLSPEVQDQLRRAAEYQKQASNNLINATNDLLKDRDNPEKKQRLEDALEDCRNSIAAANGPLGSLDEQLANMLADQYHPKKREGEGAPEYDPQELATNIARAKQILEKLADPNNKEDPEELLRELEELEQKIRRDATAAGDMLHETDPEKQRAIADLLERIAKEVPVIRKNLRDGKDIADSLARLLDGLNTLSNMVAPDANKEQIAAEMMKDDLDKLEKAADKGDAEAATQLAKRVIGHQKDLENSPFRNDAMGEKQKENVRELGKDVPANVRALKDVLNEPSPFKKDQFQKANEVVKADARQIGAYAKPKGASDLDEFLDQLDEGVRDAVEAKKDGDEKKLKETSAMIQGARSKAHPTVARSAKANTDPNRRRAEIGKWKDLSECLDDLLASMQKGADDIEVERKKYKALDAIEEYREAAGVDPLAAADNVRRSAADYVAATVKGDRDKIPEKARDTKEAADSLVGPAKKAALRTGDPETQDRVNGDLDRLEELLKELLDLGTRNVEAKTNHDEPTALATAKEMNKKYDEIDDVLDDLTSALKPGVGQKHPDGPQSVEKDVPAHLRQLFAAAKELEKKLPPVVGSAEDAKGNPGEEEKKAFAKALEDLEVPMRGVKAHDSDEDKAVALAKILEDHVDDMVGAAKEGKQDGVVSGARQASDTKSKLGPLLEELASREKDPKKQEKLRDLADQLEKQFPKTIVASKNVLQNPHDPQAREDLDREERKLDEILEGIRSAVGRTPEEKALDTKDDLQKALDDLLGCVKTNNKPGTIQESRKVGRTDLAPLKKMAEGRDNERDLLRALDRLADLLRDLEQQGPRAVETPAGSKERKELEEQVGEAKKLIDDVIGDSKAEALKAIQAEEMALRNLHDDLEDDDPANALKGDIKGVVGNHREVLEKLKEEQPKLEKSNPKAGKELEDAIEEMESLMPELIQKTKGVIVNPDDHAAQRELEEAISDLGVPLAKSTNAIAPSALNDLKAKAREVDRSGQSVASGTMNGDAEKAKKGSKKLDDLEPLKEAVETRARAMEKNDPIQARNLKDKMKEVEEASREVQRSANDPSKVGEAADNLSKTLRELEEAAEGTDINQDIALAAAQKDDLLRALKGPLSGANKLDMDALLKMAKDLSDSLGGMVGKVEDDVKRQGGGADALSALELLRELERKASEPIREKVEKKEEKKEEKKVEKPKKARAQPAAPAANAGFHERVKHVAEVIDVVADDAEDAALMSSAQGLSATLVQLADAAQRGDRMGILQNTKDAVANINKLVLVFKDIAESITDRKMKDRMVWLSSMMKDVGTNLKILCSVKAASGGPDNDDQIISVITSVKNIFTEGLDLANISEKTNKRRK